MDRRSMLLMGLAGLTVAPAFAQSNTMAPMGEAERAHLRDTLQVGTMSLELSRLAEAQASEAKVKEFAMFEVAEQETIGGLLKPMFGAAPPVDPMQAEMVKKLEAAGSRFDRDYVEAQIQGHNKLLQIQNAYLAAGKAPAHVIVAKLARGMILEHLTLLGDLQKEMRG